MQKIDNDGLYRLLSTIKGGSIVALESLTTLRIPKYEGLGVVSKYEKQTLQVGCSYQNSVNRRLDCEKSNRNSGNGGNGGKFISMPLKWGKWAVLNRIIEHKGAYYGRFYIIENSNSSVCYFVDGRIATPKETEIIMRHDQDTYSNRQAEYGLVTHQVKPKTYKFDSIRSIVYGKETYQVENRQIPSFSTAS